MNFSPIHLAINGHILYNVLFKKCNDVSKLKSGYWVASSSVYAYSGGANFGLRVCADGWIGDSALYISNGTNQEKSIKMVPVVTLESKLKTTGKDANGVWQLKVD